MSFTKYVQLLFLCEKVESGLKDRAEQWALKECYCRKFVEPAAKILDN